MKKLFTLVCGMMLALSANAYEQIKTTFNSWGEGCAVDGNTLIFTQTWKGAGVDFTEGDENNKTCTDMSDYDYLWVVFSETTCDFKIDTQYTPKYNQDVAEEFISGTLCAGVKLNEDYSDQFAQYFIQNKTLGKVVVKAAYVGTEKEYKEFLANNKPEKSDLSLSDLGSGWGGSTYDSATKTVTIGEDMSGKGWWLSSADYSDFDKVVVNFDPATVTNGKIVVEYNSAESDFIEFAAGSTSVEIELNPAAKNSVKQIYIQGPAAATFTLASAYVCGKDYVPTGISSATVATPVAKTSKIYNLAGQQVSESYKGVVIKNGKKFVQK